MPVLTRVFVYGTLLPGERNAHIAARGARHDSCAARLSGFRLFHLSPEGYPAIVAGETGDTVFGAALTYAPADWPAARRWLDELEGVDETPPLYTREQVTLTLGGGEAAPAWVYVYAQTQRLGQPGAERVLSGDWRDVQGRDRPGSDGR